MLLNLTIAREIAYDVFIDVMTHKTKPEEALDEYYRSHADSINRLDRS